MSQPLGTVPAAERPRERMWFLGPSALTATELLAILIGTGRGGQSVLEVACSWRSAKALSGGWPNVLALSCFEPMA